MAKMYHAILSILTFSQLAIANVEKTIFLGPSNQHIPTQHPTLNELQLHTLSPQNWIIRTQLQAEFPTNITLQGSASWLLLDHLSEGRRYEVRICWAASQPTSFKFDTYELHEAFDSPELITSLAVYSETQQSKSKPNERRTFNVSRSLESSKIGMDELRSVLLLRILTAADYYTMNRTLMEHVQPILVDIVLDPYLLNVLPRSLLSTGVYLTIVAILSWCFARLVAKWLQIVASINEQKKFV